MNQPVPTSPRFWGEVGTFDFLSGCGFYYCVQLDMGFLTGRLPTISSGFGEGWEHKLESDTIPPMLSSRSRSLEAGTMRVEHHGRIPDQMRAA